MSYRDNVRAAAAALQRGEDANWELARLTFENTSFRGQTSGTVSVQQWSDDIRSASGRSFGIKAAMNYRAIWERFGQLSPGTVRPEWGEAYTEIRGGTVGERMVEADFNRALSHATPEQKREVFQRIVRDEPEVVQQAWKDTATNVALSEARWQAREEQIAQPAREARAVFEPTDTTLDRTSFFYDIQKKVDQWARELDGIRDFLANTEDVNYVTRKATRSSFELLIHAAEECRDALSAAREDDMETPRRRRGALAG